MPIKQHLLRVCTVCLNYRKLKVKWNSVQSPFRNIFPAYTQRQSTHQCCQYFDSRSMWYPLKWLPILHPSADYISIFFRIIKPILVILKIKYCLNLSLPQAMIIGFCKQHRSRWDGSMSRLIWIYTVWQSVFQFYIITFFPKPSLLKYKSRLKFGIERLSWC